MALSLINFLKKDITDKESNENEVISGEAHRNPSEEFCLLEEETETTETDAETETEFPPKVITRIVIQRNQHEIEFMYKVWTAFLTFHVFLVPTLIGLIIGLLLSYDDTDEDIAYRALKYNLVTGLVGASIMVGLPFHMMSLADLEDTIQDIRNCETRQYSDDGSDSLFQVSESNGESSLNLADGDSIEKAVNRIP